MDGNARHSDDLTPPTPPTPRASCGILAIGVLALAGCSGGMQAIDADHARWLDEGDSIAARLERLPAETSDTPSDIDPASLRGPEDYVQLALVRNPSIRAAEARVAMLRERVPQARSLEDPMLMVAPIGQMAETAAGQVGAMTTLSQKLPLGGKLDARGQIAEREAGQARADLARARVDLAGDVRRAYWSYVLAGRTIQTTLESRALFVQFRDVADAQYRSGERQQQDVLRAAAELGSIDTELARMTQQRDSAAAALRRFIAAPGDLVLPEPSAAASESVTTRRDELIERASRINPSLRAGAERLGQFEARQRLAHLERWPDLTLSLSYNLVSNDGLAPSRTGDDQWWIGMAVNLPIWRDRLDAAEREAMFGRLEAASSLAAERDRITFDIEDAMLRVESQRQIRGLLHDQVLPDTRAAVEASANAYRSGTGDFLMLIDNWRKLLAQQVLEHEVDSGLEQALADLARAVGDESSQNSVSPAEGSAP